MTADVRPARTAVRPAPGVIARVVGFGSVFGKTLRDSRRAFALVGLLAGLLMLATAAGIASQFPSATDRLTLVAQAELLPVALRGLLGEPIAVEHLGGFVSWRVGNTLPAMLGIWSVLALSGTLAGEAARGSLDVLASMPVPRWRIALEKLIAHVVGVALALVIAAVLTSASGDAFGTLPGDDIPLSAAMAHFALTGLLMLVAGCAAFAAAPIVGRGRAAAIGFLVLFGGYLVPAYASAAPIMHTLEPLSPFAWTVNHRPLAGRYDWASLGGLALLVIGLGAAGVVAFGRRDLGRTAELRWFRLPSLPAGTRNPFVRQLADRTGAAIGWGLGIGLYGAMIAASASAMTEGLLKIPQIRQMITTLYPGVDITEPSGILQLAFFSFGSLLAGLAGAGFAGGWAGDETGRRLDLVLSTPSPRVRWALESGLGAQLAGLITMAVAAILVGLALAGQGGELIGPLAGMGVLALFIAAIAGVGIAVGGAVGPDLAVPVAGGLVIGSYLLETIGSILRLPDWVLSLSLNHHFGQPIAGVFDPFGLAVMAVLAVGGLGVGAWGLGRRDLRG